MSLTAGRLRGARPRPSTAVAAPARPAKLARVSEKENRGPGGRRFVGRARWLNCWLALLGLLLRGRLCGVALRWSGPRLPHLMGVAWSGRLVHFRSLRRPGGCEPLWFQGRVEVLPRGFRPRRTLVLACPSPR